MKILKASAGSGKTFRLAKQYLDILLNSRDPYIYRHVLAVTFTNKATAEMKSRILKFLFERSKEDPKAERLLVDMLHDYGSFSVSTIDKFFQTALKSFSREIGQFADYQIELDRQSLIAETMDRILDSLTEEDRDLLDWLKSSVSESLEQGRKLKIEDSLYEMGALLKSEEHRIKAEGFALSDAEMFSKERLAAVRKECRRIIDSFTARAKELGVTVTPGEKIKRPSSRTLKSSPAELTELFSEPYRRYCTMWTVDSMVYSLGVAGEFYKGFDALLREKNLMCLDESNVILKDIIDGSDAPFVYEKTGTRYDHFLLDEFQDTSRIQWENFLPLLQESESRGGCNLIVGDVKQSIYRWRNSDWRLLGSGVGEAFPGADVEVLGNNWRSARRIVEFNNGFFEFASRQFGLGDLYSDVRQGIKTRDEQEGCVRLSFVDDQVAAVLGSIADAREAGAQWGDVAILVRNNQEGSSLASELIANGIPVISDDSLKLKSSLTVRRLVSLLSNISNPDDAVGSYLVSSLNISLPVSYHSLPDLCEALLRELQGCGGDAFATETLYIQAFMDEVRSWTDVNGGDLTRFLKHWESSDLTIGSPDNAGSVRIMTIHKAKGLEFPYVIFPYAEKVSMYKAGDHWCALETDGTGIDSCARLIYPVSLTKDSAATCFSGDYDRERELQIVDNINLFYVALTRAVCTLHVIAKQPSKACRDSLGGANPHYGNFSELLYHYGGASEEVTLGEQYDFEAMERPAPSAVRPFDSTYVSIPIGDRLSASEEAEDFFGPDGVTGIEASPRLSGILLHDILSSVRKPSDLDSAVENAVLDGKLTPEEARAHKALLASRIGSHPEWFSGDCRNEVSLFGADGEEYRPDRVVFREGSTLVIDYKFGHESSSYLRQVRGYIEIYRAMGYPDVSGAVWYVGEDKVVPVI